MKKITVMIVPPGSSKIFKLQLNKLLFALMIVLLLGILVYSGWMIFNFSTYIYEKEKNKTLAARYELLVKEREEDKKKLEKIRKDLSEMETLLGKISNLIGVDVALDIPPEDQFDETAYETKWIGDTLKEYNYISRDNFLRLSTPAFIPVNGWISSRFDYRQSSFTSEKLFHYGVDIIAPQGRIIRAAADGIVANIRDDEVLGKVIYIYHRWGYVSLYGHTRKAFKAVGDKVTMGEAIGEVGVTGRTTGPHLHFQIDLLNVPVNPEISGMKIANKTLIQ
jgi:murein DD-endopeptidase MepM/ murein hydrolase activator NlpD